MNPNNDENQTNDPKESKASESKGAKFFDKVKGFFGQFKSGQIKEIPLEDVPQGIHGCKTVYMSLYEDESHPIYIGIDGDQVRVSFGLNDTFHLDKEMFTYMSGAFFNMGATILKNEFGDQKPLKSIAQSKQVIHDGPLEQPLDEETQKQQDFEKLERTVNGYDDEDEPEQVKLARDVQSKMQDLDPEERRKMKTEAQQQEMTGLESNVKEFEDSLLGDIDRDDDITYDHDYFVSIYKKKGLPALREELATIDKAQRKPIMDKIMAEEDSQQQKPDNNDSESKSE